MATGPAGVVTVALAAITPGRAAARMDQSFIQPTWAAVVAMTPAEMPVAMAEARSSWWSTARYAWTAPSVPMAIRGMVPTVRAGRAAACGCKLECLPEAEPSKSMVVARLLHPVTTAVAAGALRFTTRIIFSPAWQPHGREPVVGIGSIAAGAARFIGKQLAKPSGTLCWTMAAAQRWLCR